MELNHTPEARQVKMACDIPGLPHLQKLSAEKHNGYANPEIGYWKNMQVSIQVKTNYKSSC